MTEKDIREAIASSDSEINKLTGEPILPEEKSKPIRLSGDTRAKYFSGTPQKKNTNYQTDFSGYIFDSITSLFNRNFCGILHYIVGGNKQ